MTKFILNLKRYDTEQCLVIADFTVRRYTEEYVDKNRDIKREFCHEFETLYRTKYENYFIVKSSDTKYCYYEETYREISAIEAIEWLCYYRAYDKVEEFFGFYLQDA